MHIILCCVNCWLYVCKQHSPFMINSGIKQRQMRRTSVEKILRYTSIQILNIEFTEPVAPNLTYQFLVVYKVHNHTMTFTLLPDAPCKCLCHYFNLHHSKFPSSWKKKLNSSSPKLVCTMSHNCRNFHLHQNTL